MKREHKMVNNLFDNFINLLHHLNKPKRKTFSGTGIVLYHAQSNVNHYHCHLINEELTIPPLQLGHNALTQYLADISSYQHPCHDGFHFINNQGFLTHISQFFSPPISEKLSNVTGQGARTLCALHGSKIEGVLMIGTISSNNDIFIFKNGRIMT